MAEYFGREYTNIGTQSDPVYQLIGGGTGGGTGGGGAGWSSGWVNTDGTTAVTNGATLDFTHNLGTTDLTASIWVADDANGTNAAEIRNYFHANAGYEYGAVLTSISTTSTTLQLLANGWIAMNSSGEGPGLSYGSQQSWSGHYVKVILSGSGTGGGTVSSSGGDGHIWQFVSEGSAPLLIDQRVLFAPQCHGTNNHSRLYVSDINGELTQTIFSGPKWPSTTASTGTQAALRTSIFADWETATSTNVDVYVSYVGYILKIQFDRTTQTFGTPYGYGEHSSGGDFFNTNWKIAAMYNGGTSNHFICSFLVASNTHSIIGGSNRLEAMEYLSTGTGGYFNLTGTTRYLGDFRPLIKSPDGKQLIEGSGGTGPEAVYANLVGINHVTGRAYYRGLSNGFLYIFQINPNATGSTYAEKLWNMASSSVPNPVNSNLTYYKTALLSTTGGDPSSTLDTTINFDENGNETGISYASIWNDGNRHNVNMGILEWNPNWN